MKRVFLFLMLIFTACQPSGDPVNQTKFDRTAFLKNYAEKFIIPGYGNFLSQLELLKASLSDKEASRTQWINTYEAFLQINAFNLGPAEEQVIQKSLTEEIATFPVKVSVINEKLNSGNFGFDDFQRDTRGLLALEYLLFDENVQALPNHQEYIQACLNDIIRRVSEVSTAWGTYSEEFINNDGTSAGSSTSALYNEFLKSFEALKNFKLGLPLGLRPGQTVAVPENIEARFSGQSLTFALADFESIKNIWKGTNNLGFKDYLLTVEGGEALVLATEAQILNVEAAFEACSNSDFDVSNLDQNTNLIQLHTELQKLTRYFKSDMSSILGIAITFSSGDGD